MILVPVKNLAHAKQRLAGIMEQPERTELAQAMLHDVLAAITTWGALPCTLVSSDPYACKLADELGLNTLPDLDNSSETAAIEMATRICLERGCAITLVLPADIPLLTCEDLVELMKHAPAHGSLLVPAADGRGTNAAFRSPANLFPLRFGNDSFKPHLAAARAANLPCVILDLPRIALDVDRPQDLYQLASLPGETRAQQFAREFLQGSELLPTGSGPA